MLNADAQFDWLLQGPAWVAYRTRIDLLGQSEADPEVVSARQGLQRDKQVQMLITKLADWPGEVIASHKSAGQPFHKLTFLADLGLKRGDAGINHLIAEILSHQSEEGPFQIPMKISTGHGGSGETQWAWALCDAPLLIYALIKFGAGDLPEVKQAMQYLVELVRENGYPCIVSKELGNFRGPGHKDDPCPFATLAMLKVFSVSDSHRDCKASRIGVETMLNLWETSSTRHPYIFYMGNDFRKLKVPFIWYDLMHVLDVLTNFQWAREDPRLLEMVNLMLEKADAQGRYMSESVWTAWKDWEFGQKKEPSRWLTLLAWRIIQRMRSQA